jgi:hypothetical protein
METRYSIRTFRIVHSENTFFGKADGPDDVVPLLRAIFRDACDADREHFVVLAVDARGKIIGYKVVASGTVTAALISPRQILSVAFAFHNAVSLIVSHSHPSQDASPSSEDERLTERLIEAGAVVGVNILDHIIVASSGAADSEWRSVMPASTRSRTVISVAPHPPIRGTLLFMSLHRSFQDRCPLFAESGGSTHLSGSTKVCHLMP